jgi:hypothetical protein
LCIDADTVAATIAKIAAARPDVVDNVAAVATLLDPDSTDKFTEAAKPATPDGTAPAPPPPVDAAKPPINNEIPPGGGEPPSPE